MLARWLRLTKKSQFRWTSGQWLFAAFHRASVLGNYREPETFFEITLKFRGSRVEALSVVADLAALVKAGAAGSISKPDFWAGLLGRIWN
jgi:hypothetical protein